MYLSARIRVMTTDVSFCHALSLSHTAPQIFFLLSLYFHRSLIVFHEFQLSPEEEEKEEEEEEEEEKKKCKKGKKKMRKRR